MGKLFSGWVSEAVNLQENDFMRAIVFAFVLLGSSVWAMPMHVDLRAVLRLAGERNEEVEAARKRHAEALVESRQSWQRYWPTLSIGGGYRGHEGRLQDIVGAVFDASKQQYFLGAAVVVDWTPGETHYAVLAAKQRSVASGKGIDRARLEIVREAADRYYELLGGEAGLSVVLDDVAVTERYAGQLEAAVKVGTAFRADLLRVRTQLGRLRLQVRQLEEGVELSAARLSETLRLPSDTALRAAKADMVAVVAVREERLGALISRALAERPEMASVVALTEAERTEEERARMAPWIPSVQAGYSAGGLGGGMDGRMGRFGGQQDFFVGLSWKVGAGGLFDSVRRDAATVRKESLGLSGKRLEAAIGREVVEAYARSRSAREQIKIAEESVVAAEEMTRLAGERQASQVGVVLEYITAREDLTRARLAQVRAVVDYNRAQQALKMALGGR